LLPFCPLDETIASDVSPSQAAIAPSAEVARFAHEVRFLRNGRPLLQPLFRGRVMANVAPRPWRWRDPIALRGAAIALGGAHATEGIDPATTPADPGLSVRINGLAVLLASSSLLLEPATASGGEWDDVAALFYGSTNRGPGCAGTLVAPDVVMTSAACIGGITDVAVGSADWSSPDREVIPVARQVEYPDPASTYDVGLVLLERPAHVEPRLIGSDCVVDWLAEGAPVTAVGWGGLQGLADRGPSTHPAQLDTTVFDGDCAGSAACNPSIAPDGEIGAGEADPDSCVGDEGGPLYMVGPDETGYLVGVSSRSYDRPASLCSGRRIYVRADAVVLTLSRRRGRRLRPSRPARRL
jgi:hypothetical protein